MTKVNNMERLTSVHVGAWMEWLLCAVWKLQPLTPLLSDPHYYSLTWPDFTTWWHSKLLLWIMQTIWALGSQCDHYHIHLVLFTENSCPHIYDYNYDRNVILKVTCTNLLATLVSSCFFCYIAVVVLKPIWYLVVSLVWNFLASLWNFLSS